MLFGWTSVYPGGRREKKDEFRRLVLSEVEGMKDE